MARERAGVISAAAAAAKAKQKEREAYEETYDVAVALFDFEMAEATQGTVKFGKKPGAEDFLTLSEGDDVVLLKADKNHAWWLGENEQGVKGWFLSTYVVVQGDMGPRKARRRNSSFTTQGGRRPASLMTKISRSGDTVLRRGTNSKDDVNIRDKKMATTKGPPNEQVSQDFPPAQRSRVSMDLGRGRSRPDATKYHDHGVPARIYII